MDDAVDLEAGILERGDHGLHGDGRAMGDGDGMQDDGARHPERPGVEEGERVLDRRHARGAVEVRDQEGRRGRCRLGHLLFLRGWRDSPAGPVEMHVDGDEADKDERWSDEGKGKDGES